MIKSVVFDWGGVLIEDPSVKIYDYCAAALSVSQKDFINVYEQFAPEFQKGTISEDLLLEHICSVLHITKPTQSSLWEDAFRHSYEENTETFNLASRLKKNGFRIGLLSNTEAPAMRFFHEQQYPMFDVTVFSCAEGTRKPEERIYKILLQRLQLQPDEVLFIDDNMEYTLAAAQVRINTILFKNHQQLRQALTSFI